LATRADCRAFLRYALPHLGLHWPGYRRVHGQVCKRIVRRIRALGLTGFDPYRTYVTEHPEEWQEVDRCCQITISACYRDPPMFDALARGVLPRLAQEALDHGRTVVRCWSAGCASGEEPYSLSIAWRLAVTPALPGVRLDVVATDTCQAVIARARAGCYAAGSLRALPPAWAAQAFARVGREFCLRPPFRDGVGFICQDLRAEAPAGPFDLVLCRNLAFTYFAPAMQATVEARLAGVLRPGGVLVIGRRERLPEGQRHFTALADCPYAFSRRP
jgi:chemotaxis protein methyltransferase CheR